MSDWYDETARAGAYGEINVPAMSLLQGLLMGNGVRSVVELGHFYGYSTLLTGFMLRSMGNGGRMVSIDIDPKATAFTQNLLAPGTPVRLERDVVGRDDYGRLLAYVYRASDGILVNYEIIRQGYARPLTIPPNDSYANLFVDAAGEAQRAAAGLWSSCRG